MVTLGRDRFTFSVVTPQPGQAGGAAADGGLSLGSLPRWAQAIDLDDDESGSGEEGGAASASTRPWLPAAAAPPKGEAPVLELELRPEAGADAGGRALMDAADEAAARRGAGAGADGEDDSDEEDEDGRVSVSYDVLTTGYGRVDAVASSVSDGAEPRILLEVSVGRLMRQQQREEEAAAAARRAAGEAEPAGGSGRGASQDTFDRLAVRVAKLQVREREGG